MGNQVTITTPKATIIVVYFPTEKGKAMATALLCNPNFGKKEFRDNTPLGPVSEITEDVWKSIVEDPFTKGIGQYTEPDDKTGWVFRDRNMGACWEKLTHVSYRDYTLIPDNISLDDLFPFKSATESGLSLLKANGVVLDNPEKPYFISNISSEEDRAKSQEQMENYFNELSKVWSNPHIFLTP